MWKLKYETTEDFYVVNFYEGQGRLQGSLGAIGVGKEKGRELMRVGGGFTDEERQAVWNHLTLYDGMVVEVRGKGCFESGALRHPEFVRWRRDKSTP